MTELTIQTRWYRAICDRTDEGTEVQVFTHCPGDAGGTWRLAGCYLFDDRPHHVVCDEVYNIITRCPPPEAKRVDRRLVPVAAQLATMLERGERT